MSINTWPQKSGEALIYTELDALLGEISQKPAGRRRILFPRGDGWFEIDKDGKIADIITAPKMPGFIGGARLAFESVSEIRVGTTDKVSVLADSTGKSILSFTGELTADITLDLDTGSEVSDTWYAPYVEWEQAKPTNFKFKLTTTPDTPILSGGRGVFRRVGWARNNGSSNFLKFEQFDSGPDRRVEYDEERLVTQILTGGNKTVYTDVSAASFVAPSARHGIMHYEWDPANPANQFNIRPKGSTVTAPLFTIATRNDQEAGSHPFFTDSSQNIQFKVSAAGDLLDLFVAGYVDNL